jgi:hypothetical protein
MTTPIPPFRMLAAGASVLIASLLTPASAHAWNKAGHMTSGAIAYRELKNNDPATLSRVIELLRQHPQFEERWADKLERTPAEDRDQLLFMLAARWPDDVRGDADFHHDKWHYINFPFRPPSTATSTPNGEDILDGFEINTAILKNAQSEAADRAVALCWIFHLTGDIHQPLHSSALINNTFPQGDRGGTRFFVRITEQSGTFSLHKIWDDIIIRNEAFQGVKNRATELVNRSALQRTQLPELADTSVENWARQESFKIAREVAYKNGTLAGSTNEDDGELLPQDYIQQAKPVAERRMVLAGYRLADLLKSLVRQ